MLEYPFQPDSTTLSIVAPDIVLNGVLYHGTSAAYSPQIEKSGLTLDHIPIGKETLHNVIAFLEKLLTVLKNDEEITKMVGLLNNQFKIHTISMTVIGHAAVKYATSPLKGGQIIKILGDAVELIKVKVGQLPADGQENESLRLEAKKISQPIVSFCEQILAADGVIYIIQIDQNFLPALDMPGLPVFCNRSIPVANILAKVIIPAGTVFNEEWHPQLEKLHRQATLTRGTIAFRLKEKFLGLDEDPIDDDAVDNF